MLENEMVPRARYRVFLAISTIIVLGAPAGIYFMLHSGKHKVQETNVRIQSPPKPQPPGAPVIPPIELAKSWQKEKLAGTRFAECLVAEKDKRFFLKYPAREGDVFALVLRGYCKALDLKISDCDEAAKLVQKYHSQEHWHQNIQPGDAMYLRIPDKVVQPPS